MSRELLKIFRAKIHKAHVTHADVEYEGSITIPPELLEASSLMEFEAVNIWDVTNGARLETYIIKGKPGSTDICVNGAAAHLVRPGDVIIVAAFSLMTKDEAKGHKPVVVFVDKNNRVREKRAEVAGPDKVKS